jgi:HAD superfamily hydrolase (TIGR01484 family)
MSITRYLLASDLDGTLIPPAWDAQRRSEVAELVSAIEVNGNLILAYVTGRSLSLAQAGIADIGLPTPNWLVCDVGTSIYRNANGRFELDNNYRAAMREAFGGLSGDDVRAAIGPIEGLELQEREKQGEFKVSYYTQGRPEPFEKAARSRLDAADVRANLVTSYDPLAKRGLLDVLPERIAKDYAIRYLHDEARVDEEHLVYAGDSGNDRAAMLTGYRVIVVANADDTLKNALPAESDARGIADRIYFAEHPYARGVLEGLRHFGVLK